MPLTKPADVWVRQQVKCTFVEPKVRIMKYSSGPVETDISPNGFYLFIFRNLFFILLMKSNNFTNASYSGFYGYGF